MAKKDDPRYEIEVYLADGQSVKEQFTEAEARELMTSKAFIWKAGMSEEDKQAAAIFTILAHTIDKGSGFLSMTDTQGKTWLIRTNTIVTFNLKDLKEPGSTRQPGFGSPVVEESKPAKVLPSPAIVGVSRKTR